MIQCARISSSFLQILMKKSGETCGMAESFDVEVTIGGRLSISRQWQAVTVRAEDILEYFK